MFSTYFNYLLSMGSSILILIITILTLNSNDYNLYSFYSLVILYTPLFTLGMIEYSKKSNRYNGLPDFKKVKKEAIKINILISFFILILLIFNFNLKTIFISLIVYSWINFYHLQNIYLVNNVQTKVYQSLIIKNSFVILVLFFTKFNIIYLLISLVISNFLAYFYLLIMYKSEREVDEYNIEYVKYIKSGSIILLSVYSFQNILNIDKLIIVNSNMSSDYLKIKDIMFRVLPMIYPIKTFFYSKIKENDEHKIPIKVYSIAWLFIFFSIIVINNIPIFNQEIKYLFIFTVPQIAYTIFIFIYYINYFTLFSVKKFIVVNIIGLLFYILLVFNKISSSELTTIDLAKYTLFTLILLTIIYNIVSNKKIDIKYLFIIILYPLIYYIYISLLGVLW